MTTLDVAALVALLAACGGVEVGSTDAAPPRIDAAPQADVDAADAVALDLIDDLEDGDFRIVSANGRVGYWYVVNDETGTQEPWPDFAPTLGGANGSSFSAQTSGSGFTDWGAKLGFYLYTPDDDAALEYDIGSYTGLQFQARGDVRIRAVVVTTAALDQAFGGTCVQMKDLPCDDYHGQLVELTDDWQQYRISFANLTQNGWGQAFEFDRATARSIEFEMENVISFDIAIDDIAFYTEEAP